MAAVTLPLSVQENLDGAQEHFEALEAEVMAFWEREPYAIVHEHDPDFTQHTLRFVFSEPFPAARWGRMFGDGLHSLADALDHLVYAIAIHESGSDPPPDDRVLLFPVWTNFQKPAPSMWRVATLSEPVRAAIEAEQPDPIRPEDSLLWQLYQFNSAKKHRVIHMSSTHHSAGRVDASGIPPGEHRFTWHLVGLEDEAPFLTIDLAKPAPDMQMGSETTGYIAVQRISGQGRPEDLLPLGDLCDALLAGTRGIVSRVATAAGI